jgi:acyl-CoA thioesterase
MPDTTFATLLDRAQNVTGTTPLRVPGDWMQGRAGYGGLVGALALKAMRAQVPAERKVRSLSMAFVGPVGSAPFSIQTQKLRTGKSVTTVEAKVIQDGDICSENDWWAYRSTVDSAERGYVHEQGAVWDPEGRLAVHSRQTLTVFA